MEGSGWERGAVETPTCAPTAPADGLDRRIDRAVEAAADSLRRRQAADGHWAFPLEADVTIPAEYILLEHFIDDIDAGLEARLADYIRRRQGRDGGWPLFHAGDADVSASVKAYFALKCAGDDPGAPHMRRARAAILERGGAARCNVFTRISLALFGQLPWRAVPVMPVEIMLLPRWFPFHLDKVSYWSRTVIVPLLVLLALRPRAANPGGVDIAELFDGDPWRRCPPLAKPTGGVLDTVFLAADRTLRLLGPLSPPALRRRALDRALAFIEERLNGEHGLGGIFPAMANAVMTFHALGCGPDDPRYAAALGAMRNLLVAERGETFCQPCLSPVWDTALAAHALMEAGGAENRIAAERASSWLVGAQIADFRGDWARGRPDLAPGGWAFEYRNDFYPDTDDTAAVVMAIDRARLAGAERAIRRGADWVLGMQSANGGWGSFDVDNTRHYLDSIPFADHGALLDPPTADVTARCVGMLAQLGHGRDHPAVARGVRFLLREQEADGSWYGRWGMNYVYGTWCALTALNAVGEDCSAPHVRRAVRWLEDAQREDGGWGEHGTTYWPDRRGEARASTASQTAWAVLGLMAAGEAGGAAARRGVEYLLDAPREDGGLAGGVFQRGRVPPRLLPEISRLQRLFPGLGAGPLPQPARRQREDLAFRVVTAGRLVGIVTGLPAEARAAGGGGGNVRVLCAGASPQRAGAQARSLAGRGAAGLASFGVAGGLDPGLPAGTLVVATGIVAPGGTMLEVDREWADRIAAALPPGLRAVRAPVAGADAPVAAAAAKAALAASTGAAAVDMESHAVARAAGGLPVVAIRAIADPAGRDLPASALALAGASRARALRELCRRPGDLPALAALALDYRRALAALRRAVAAAGPDLRFFG